MSYTKFSKAVTKWLKANDLPCYGTAYDMWQAAVIPIWGKSQNTGNGRWIRLSAI